MTENSSSERLREDKLFKVSALSTAVAFILCVSTHVITLFGLAGAVAWLGTIEHALLFLAVGLALLTGYAVFKHRRTCGQHPEQGN
ncbi:hypothetical protein [Halomonas llamarensis]|uniref:Uncharacterized protein n=1 Tax=Halomonas llamarensis TaxID=2945104 RepID=A0ABT0SLN0_9GAMM|nr:hypothetical protein [Halomonas llamarensis]MCL7928705.1 hypothetical protein [Halomonas llamarensis]